MVPAARNFFAIQLMYSSINCKRQKSNNISNSRTQSTADPVHYSITSHHTIVPNSLLISQTPWCHASMYRQAKEINLEPRHKFCKPLLTIDLLYHLRVIPFAYRMPINLRLVAEYLRIICQIPSKTFVSTTTISAK